MHQLACTLLMLIQRLRTTSFGRSSSFKVLRVWFTSMNTVSLILCEKFDDAGVLRRLLHVLNNDYGAAVMTIIGQLNSFKERPLPLHEKSEFKSEELRKLGNAYYKIHDYGNAMSSYNMAMMNAPEDSYELALAFSNRSSLLLQLMKYNECLKDIETCLAMPHPTEIEKKLMDRKNKCLMMTNPNLSMLQPEAVDPAKFDKFFQLPGKAHKTIPCASASLDIINEKVVAAKDIAAGEVVVVETAYASCLKNVDIPMSCHYCHRFSHNLIACKTCCLAMYCDNDCRNKSWQMVHRLECKVFKLGTVTNRYVKCSVQAVLKAVTAANVQSKGWNQLTKNAESAERSKSHYIEGPYESTAYQNLCTPPKYDQLTRRGLLFDCAVNTAIVVHTLSGIKSIMPHGRLDKERVMYFLASQIMNRCEKNAHMEISKIIAVKKQDSLEPNYSFIRDNSYGIFPFIKLIEPSCHPNVVSFGLGNKVALVAVTNIRKGTEIFTSYCERHTTMNTIERKRFLYTNYGFICKCEACRKNWVPQSSLMEQDLLKEKKVNFNEYLKYPSKINESNVIMEYPNICKLLAMFYDHPTSPLLEILNRCFHLCYSHFQVSVTNHYMKGLIDPKTMS